MPRGKNKGIHIKFRKDRQCWEVVEYVAGKLKRHSTGFGCRSSAEEKLAEIIVQRASPQRSENHINLGELMAYYTQNHLSTLPRATSSFKAIERLAPFWGDLKLCDITKANSLAYLEHRKKEYAQWLKDSGYVKKRILSGATVRREIDVLQAAINFSYGENIISINPYVWRPDKAKSRERWLTKSEFAKLLRTALHYPRVREYMPMLLLLGVYTGARSEALFKLKWTDVNFETNRIDFSRIYNTKNKTGSIIPIPRKLRAHLLRHRKGGLQMGYVIHDNQHPIKSVKTALASICEKAGIQNATLHTLRHTNVSWKIQNGASFEMAGMFAGMSPQMVKEVYGHLSPDHLEAVANL